MRKEDCFELGHIVKPHGLDGEVSAFFDVDEPEKYLGLTSVFVEIKNQLVPHFVSNIYLANGRFLIRFEDVEDVDAAAILRGKQLFLPLAMLPPLPDGQYYFHELVGFQVHDRHKGELGTVKEVFSNDTQVLIYMDYQDREVIIPLKEAIVPSVDKKAQVVHTVLPDGLLEVYLEDSPARDE